MASLNILRKEIMSGIQTLPPDKISEVLDFIRFLSSAQKKSRQEKPAASPKGPASRHILDEFIGGIEHGALASRIDEELYG